MDIDNRNGERRGPSNGRYLRIRGSIKLLYFDKSGLLRSAKSEINRLVGIW